MRVRAGILILGVLLAPIVAAAEPPEEGVPVHIEGSFKELPFHRIVNVQFTVGAIIDGMGICLEANPTIYLSIEGCADSIFFYSSLLANVKSRFLHYENITETRFGSNLYDRGFTLSLGPSVGVRKFWFMRFSCPRGGCTGEPTSVGIDVTLSAEWVYWFSRQVGLSVRLDAGQFVVPQQGGTLPTGRLTFGVAL